MTALTADTAIDGGDVVGCHQRQRQRTAMSTEGNGEK